MPNQEFISVEELFSLISRNEAQNAVTNISVALGPLKVNQSEKTFNAFVLDIRGWLSTKDRRVCGVTQMAIEKLKQNNNLSIFTHNRFTKAMVKELVNHVTGCCPNGCGKHSDIHSLANSLGIYEFYPSLTVKSTPIHT